MASKSFKINNPALSYFTEVAEEQKVDSSPQEEQVIEAKPQEAFSLHQTAQSWEQSPTAHQLPAEPPAITIRLAQDYARNTRRSQPPKTPRLYETKSKRLNLLIQPSLAADIGKLATLYRIGSNELIVRVLKEFTEKRKGELKKYDQIFLGED